MSDVQSPIDKIRTLPPERLSEVEDFVDFIASKTRRSTAHERILAAAGVTHPTDADIRVEARAVGSRQGHVR